MSTHANLFSSASDAYKQFRPQYPTALYKYLADIAPARDLAWDCGCGNGQASVALAEYFQQVMASDVSAEQIAEAEQRANICYSVSPAETINAQTASVDLVTVAQAIHWFDHSRFFAEVNRVLKPGGVLAAWGYQLMYSDSPLDSIIVNLHSDIVGAYWPKGRELLDEGYSKILFPYSRLKTPAFEMRCHWQLQHLFGYLNTWSAVKAYQANNGENPIDLIETDIVTAWGDVDQSRDVYWPLILYVGHKSD
jgi:SAM-dependent methyltransferase